MELEPVIGLEIHVQLTTKSKMFCSCANIFGDVPPNSAVCPICLGYPGTLPVPNKQAIEWIQKAGAALECELASESRFDRKSYFYPDLPKGYQISQYDKPFCGKGKLTVLVDGEEKTIGITRIHLEEDAAKNTHPHGASYSLVDYNRAGTPLIEIVTEPDIRTPQEAKAFLQELQRIMRSLGISDADMEKGQMRCDANISLRKAGEEKLHPKTEIKNVNSFRFVEKALAYELKRQQALWEKDEIPTHATRGWDADSGKTVAQRTKEEAADYRYFPEPDIPPFVFSEAELDAIRSQVPELPYEKGKRLVRQTGISAQQASTLLELKGLADFFEEVVSELENKEQEEVAVSKQDVAELVKLAASTIVRSLRTLMEEQALSYPGSLAINPENFAEVIVMLHAGTINNAAVPTLLLEMQKTGGEPDAIAKNLGLEQVNAADDLEKFADEVIVQNPDVVEKIKAGKEAAIQFLMGQVMAKSGGKANPKTIIELLRKKIVG